MSTDTKAPSAGAMRAQFEKWATIFDISLPLKVDSATKRYKNSHTEMAWVAWQQSATHVAELVEALEIAAKTCPCLRATSGNVYKRHISGCVIESALRRFKEGQPSETDEDTLSRIGKGRERQ